MKKLNNVYYSYFKTIVSIAIPLLALSVAVFTIIMPSTMDWIAIEDNVVEIISAVSLFLASLLTATFAVYSAVKHKSALLTVSMALIAIVFFVIGMEEISWLQRILSVHSSEFFIQNNAQKETNLHNLATECCELAYYIGAYILLTLLPLFHKHIHKLFNKSNLLSNLTPLLPSSWLFIPFAAIAGISYIHPFTAMLTLLTLLLLLLYLFWPASNQTNETLRTPLALLSLVCIVIGYIAFTFLDYSTLELRVWLGSEYREMFISLGLLIYACDIILRSLVRPVKIKTKKIKKH